MRRRSLLAALSAGLAGLAGCQGMASDGRRKGTFDVPPTETPAGTDEPRTTRDEPPETPPGIDPRTGREVPGGARRSVTGFGSRRRLVVEDGPLSSAPEKGRLTVGFLRPPTREAPARLWVALTNASDGRWRFEFGPSPPFSNYWASPVGPLAEERSLLLVPDDDRRFPYGDLVPETPTNGRWEATDDLGTPTGPVGKHRIALDPGESIAGTYRLLVHPDAGSLPARGVYEFAGLPWTESSLVLSAFDPHFSDPGSSRFPADRSVPDLPGPGGTRWYHRAAGGSTPWIYLRPERERLRIGEASTDLTVVNDARWTVQPGDLHLYKHHDGEWRRIAPWESELRVDLGGTTRHVPPGGRSTGRFVPARSTEFDPEQVGEGQRVGGLGSGLYAASLGPVETDGPRADTPAVITNAGDGDPTTTPDGSGTLLAALLELTGDPVGLSFTGDVAEVSREGSTATVRVDGRFGGAPAAGPELVVRRGGEPQVSLITEQVNQFPALRNALAAFEEGVGTVRVATAEGRVDRPLELLGPGSGRVGFVHDGRAYEATARNVLDPDRETTTGG